MECQYEGEHGSTRKFMKMALQYDLESHRKEIVNDVPALSPIQLDEHSCVGKLYYTFILPCKKPRTVVLMLPGS